MLAIAAFATIFHLPMATAAAEILAVELRRAEPAGAAGSRLRLAGCAVRSMYGVELYRLDVFLPAGRDLLSAMADPHSPLALRITPLHGRDSVPFPRGWTRRLSGRLSAELMSALQRAHAGMRPGDSVLLDYDPGAGTTVRKAGAVQFTTPGNGLLRAMLAMWIHDDPPISEEIRDTLLAGRCRQG